MLIVMSAPSLHRESTDSPILLKCTDGADTGDIRISSWGTVELFESGIWEPVAVSSRRWTLENSNVVCRELGYEGQQSSFSVSEFDILNSYVPSQAGVSNCSNSSFILECT